MKNLKYSHQSDVRRVVAAIFSTSGVGVVMLLILGAYPLREKHLELKREIAQVDARIASFQSLHGDQPLGMRVAREEAVGAAMRAEWRELKTQVRTFQEASTLADILASSEEGRIDYKVALYDARQWIGYRARNENVIIPADLGMRETVGTDEVMESRLWQLAANVSLADIIINSHIHSVESIAMLDPTSYGFSAVEDIYMLIYPVKLEMLCYYPSLLKFIASMGAAERFFTPQRLLVESVGPDDPGMLRVSAVCSALMFRDSSPILKTAGEMSKSPGDLENANGFGGDAE